MRSRGSPTTRSWFRGISRRREDCFRIGEKEGGYHIGFTDADFDALLREYLKGKISELLYGDIR